MNYPASIHPGLVRAHAAEMAAKPSPRDLMAKAAEMADSAVGDFERACGLLIETAATIKSFGASVPEGQQQAIEAIARNIQRDLNTLAAIRARKQ